MSFAPRGSEALPSPPQSEHKDAAWQLCWLDTAPVPPVQLAIFLPLRTGPFLLGLAHCMWARSPTCTCVTKVILFVLSASMHLEHLLLKSLYCDIISVICLCLPLKSSVVWHFDDISYFPESFPDNVDEPHCLPNVFFYINNAQT